MTMTRTSADKEGLHLKGRFRKHLCFLVAVSMAASSIGCPPREPARRKVPIIENCSIAQVSDPNDPIAFIIAERSGNTQLVLFAEKDSSGSPQRMTGAMYVGDGMHGKVKLGTNGLPQTLYTNDKYKYEFSLFTATTVDVLVTTPGGSSFTRRITLSQEARDMLAAIQEEDLDAKNGESKALTDNQKKWISVGLNAFGFGLSVAAVIATGGTALPAFLALSGSLYGLAWSSMLALSNVPTSEVNSSTVFFSTMAAAAGCSGVLGAGGLVDCADSLAVFAIDYLAGQTPSVSGGYYVQIRVSGSDGTPYGVPLDDYWVYAYPTESRDDPMLEKTLIGHRQANVGIIVWTPPDPDDAFEDGVPRATSCGFGTTFEVKCSKQHIYVINFYVCPTSSNWNDDRDWRGKRVFYAYDYSPPQRKSTVEFEFQLPDR